MSTLKWTWIALALTSGAALAADEPVGPRLALVPEGLSPALADAFQTSATAASGAQLLDYTFGSAPTDWVPAGGTWSVSSRFACDPSWSFFGGFSRGLAIIWNKREFAGDLVVEAYVSFKHGLPFNNRDWSYRPADLCLTLCGDGQDPASGYSFVYAGDEGQRTLIRRGDRVLAATEAPEFVTPSYSDARPSSEDFHRRWWRLEAQRLGHRLRFFVDGKEALVADDPERLPGGRLEVWAVRNG
ncbi:MAG: hypothetical protein HYU66_13670, partial [Armatimonadetes bacterium]|nr:hypothetical protein [Armatimonadota bacterium]